MSQITIDRTKEIEIGQYSDEQILDTIGFESNKKIKVMYATFSSDKNESDDTDSRSFFWKKMFGDKPLPEQEENAAERYAGCLSNDSGLTVNDIERVLDEIDN